MISIDEYHNFHSYFTALDASGQWVEAEDLCQRMLVLHPNPDLDRARILDALALCLMRQGKLDEALTNSYEAVQVAHQYGATDLLAWALDRRAQIYCFIGNYPRALRCLQAADNYLREGWTDGSHPVAGDTNQMRKIAGGIAQTRGMAYAGCGLWKKAALNLREAVQTFEHLRLWHEWGTAINDFAAAAFMQAESEGPDLPRLEEAAHLLDAACDQFKSDTNEMMMVHTTINGLMVRGAIAAARKDVSNLWSVLVSYKTVLHRYGGIRGVLMRSDNVNMLANWIGGRNRAVRAWADLDVPRQKRKTILNEQKDLLKKALSNAPRHAGLLCERAALYRCHAMHGLEDTARATEMAAECMESVVAIWRTESSGFTNSMLRAGWLGSAAYILESLAATAFFALHIASSVQVEVATRMIDLAQFVRARVRQDLVRNIEPLKQMPPDEQADIGDLENRIQSLHRWLSWLDAKGRHDSRSLSRGLGKIPPEHASNPMARLSDIAAKVIRRYPEYEGLVNRKQVEDELKWYEAEFDRRVTESAFLQAQSSQLESKSTFDVSTFQKSLVKGDIVLDYYVGPLELYVGVISQSDLHILRLPVNNMREFHDLANKISDLAEKSQRDHGQDLGVAPFSSVNETTLSKGDLAISIEQYSAWLFPSELVNILTRLETRRLYVVASGPLWRIPFPWLEADGKIALERWEICLVPSARLAGRDETVGELNQVFAIGHPWKWPKYLKCVREEVDQVKELLGCSVLFQKKATPDRILHEVLPAADVIHFACHGACDLVSPLMSYLQLEPDEHHFDGCLRLYEMLGVHLSASVINLGACDTARSEGLTSFPESLAHALLGAGAQHVIASLWAANDKKCLDFAHDFYVALEQVRDPATAFHKAQLEQVAEWRSRQRHLNITMLEKNLANMANFILFSARKTPSA